MRLINVETLALHEFYGDDIPKYAILSHTWGKEEVTFQDWNDIENASKKKGFAKIQGACNKAREHELEWVWVDTNCIDKTSSAELTEAINSMFDWHAQAEECYAYLEDVRDYDEGSLVSTLQKSRWFTRGWTLQELLAPEYVAFYDADWVRLGSRSGSLADTVCSITGIDMQYLRGEINVIRRASVARKMSWVARRTTTRVEDIAYCMLGLFDINMPLLYGEGIKAFTRLQNEIIKVSNDHTIFCWTWIPDVPENWTSLLARSPTQFTTAEIDEISSEGPGDEVSIYSMTNAGLSIRLSVVYTRNFYFFIFQARPAGLSRKRHVAFAIRVKGKRRSGVLHVSRQRIPRRPVILDVSSSNHLRTESLLAMNKPEWNLPAEGFRVSSNLLSDQHAMMIMFDTHELTTGCSMWTAKTRPSVPGFRERLGAVVLDTSVRSSEAIVRATMLKARRLTERNGTSRIIPEHSILRHLNQSCLSIYFFAAIKESTSSGRISGYCQVFIHDGRVVAEHSQSSSESDSKFLPRGGLNPTEENPMFADLQRQVLCAKWKQPAIYSPELDISVILDTSNAALQPGHGMPCLRFSRGMRIVVSKHSVEKPETREDDDGSGDSMAAALDQTETSEIPSTGRLEDPGLEYDFRRWKKNREDQLRSGNRRSIVSSRR